MVYRRRKKNVRQRAGMKHGWGAKKKHRGKGNKGGAGMAGTGKRADCKKPSIWKDKKYFGKFGFKKKGIIKKVKPINVDYLEEKLLILLADKKVKKEGDSYLIDLEAIGFNKLLGTGIVNHKFIVDVACASEKAINKIKEKGGEVRVKKEEKS